MIETLLGNDPGPAKKSGDLLVASSYPSPNTFEYYLTPSTVVTVVSPKFVK